MIDKTKSAEWWCGEYGKMLTFNVALSAENQNLRTERDRLKRRLEKLQQGVKKIKYKPHSLQRGVKR